MNRAVMLRMAACGIMGLGAALLIAALLLSTYTGSRITKIPLDLDATLIGEGSGTAVDPASLYSPKLVVDKNVPVVSQQQIDVESPANADVVTFQVGSSVRRSDKQKDSGLLLALVDTVTLNRKTATAVSDDTHPGGAVQKPRGFKDESPATNIALPHDGLSYRFPFHTEKRSYPYFDPIAQKAYEANYNGEEDVNGLSAYKFTQDVGYDADGKLAEPIRYPSLYADDADSKVTNTAFMWGLPGDPDEKITMTRYYAAQRTFWVDPESGTIVKEQERANHYYARDALKPEVTLVDYKITSNEETVEAQVNAARNERDRLALWSRVLPITFTAAGVIALIGGLLLGSFSLRTETALNEPGQDAADRGFFGRGEPPVARVPGAEAETEKIPTQPKDVKRDGPSSSGGPSTRPRPPLTGPAGAGAPPPGSAVDPSRVFTGVDAPRGGAAAEARLPTTARRRLDAAVVRHRRRSRPGLGPAGDTTGFCDRTGLACRRRRHRRESTARRRPVAGRLGRGATGRAIATGVRCRWRIRGDHAGRLESLCGRAAAARALEPVARLRLPAVDRERGGHAAVGRK